MSAVLHPVNAKPIHTSTSQQVPSCNLDVEALQATQAFRLSKHASSTYEVSSHPCSCLPSLLAFINGSDTSITRRTTKELLSYGWSFENHKLAFSCSGKWRAFLVDSVIYQREGFHLANRLYVWYTFFLFLHEGIDTWAHLAMALSYQVFVTISL